MSSYRATVALGDELLEVVIGPDGSLEPPTMALIVADVLLELEPTVELTATGPTVELAADDPFSIIAWIRDTFEILDDEMPDSWEDPRTVLPDGAVG